MTALAMILGLNGTAHAQQSVPEAAAPTEAEGPRPEQDIIVTGSRIRRSVDATASTPVATLQAENFENRGFVQAGDALAELTTNANYRLARASLSNGQAAPGADYPNLFNLGPARTLTLVNGRRTASTALGLGDEAVDTNIIPIGLLDRIEVVQGGGAAVYGSGAIGGVVNYVLKRNFEGVTADAQYGISSDGDYTKKSFRVTAGQNFGGGRGNISGEFGYSKSDPLVYQDRQSRGYLLAGPNPAPGAGANGIPATLIYNSASQYLDADGLVLTSPFDPTASGVLQQGGAGLTIGSDGNLQRRNLGVPVPGIPFFTSGSELNWPFFKNIPLVTGVERYVGSLNAHYEISDNLEFFTELLGARTKAETPLGGAQPNQFLPILSIYPALGAIPFTRDNAYLSSATIQSLSAANPGFAAGQPLYLAKQFYQDPLGGDAFYETTTLRGVVGLTGKFSLGERNFDYDLSYSHSRVTTKVDSYAALFPNFRNAANAVRSGGQIVCAINVPVVTDPRCVPFNVFGQDRPSDAALAYIVGQSSSFASIAEVKNLQDDFLATLSGDIIRLPTGTAKFSASYEHRDQRATFTPTAADQAGLTFSGIKILTSSGGYNTDEFAGELEVPLIGGDFTLPLVKSIDLSGSYRYVNNSLAGGDSVWGAGARWTVVDGLTLRGSRSRNFRAPSINQLAAPATVTIGGFQNPCSRTNIASGPAPATRASNCLALFTANPTFGLNSLPAGTANTPQNRLANYFNTTTSQTQVTTGGNPDLQNEISNTWTLGFVFQPRFIPGLTITADRIDLKIGNALTLYSVNDFAASCFDASPQPANLCRTFTYDANGDFITGTNTTVNAGRLRFKADTFNVDYRFPLSKIAGSLPGTLNLTVAATHNRLQEVTFAGTTTRTDNTVVLPRWSGQFSARFIDGPLRLFYTLNYLPSALLTYTSTVENSPNGLNRVKSNDRHDFSIEYEVEKRFSLRAGVIDAFNKQNSYPNFNYGNIIGRQLFVGATTKF